MIDTHAHIDFEAFDADRDEMIQRSIDNGVEYIIIPAVESRNYSKIISIAEMRQNIFCAIGLHPHNALEASEDIYKKISDYADNENVKAIGEIGIDYHYDFAPRDKQKEVFKRQLDIAIDKGLPAIVHNREADEDVTGIIKEAQNGALTGVLHCFSSPVEIMSKALNLGFYISFTGNITFKKSNLDDSVAYVPIDRLLLETDSPFMTPAPNRGKRNEPMNLKYIAQKIAEIKSISIEEVIKMTNVNAKKLFNLSVFLLFFLIAVSTLQSQSILDDIDEEKALDGEELIHPYPKFIGIGPVFGANTVVETYVVDKQDHIISYEGLFLAGAAITYGVFDYLVIEAAYNYSKNVKIAEQWDFTIKPSIYQNFELSSHWIVNPYSRVNFFATLGLTAFFNSYNNVPNQQIGPNGGLGFYINIPFDLGLLNIAAEWRINFETVPRKQKESVDSERILNTTAFYSIPRLMILFYPKF